MGKNDPTLGSLILRFKRAYAVYAKSIQEMARIYTVAVDLYGEAATEAFAEKYSLIDRVSWQRLEQIGRGALDPRLFNMRTSAGRAIERLPVKLQRKVLTDGVSVANIGRRNTVIAVADLSADQVRQVFSFDTVRTPAQQRLYLANKTERPAWEIDSDTGDVVVHRPCRIKAEKLLNLLDAYAAKTGV